MSKIVLAIENDDYLGVKDALKKGEDPNQEVEISEDEYTPLLFFALRKRVSVDIIKLLIDSGADKEYMTYDGVGLLDEAVVFGDIEVIKYLIEELKMDINTTKRKSGMTPFMQACCYGNLNLISYIKDCGADMEARDKNGMNALDYSRKLGQKKVKEYLEQFLS